MYYKQLKSLIRPQSHKCRTYKKRKTQLQRLRILSSIKKSIHVFILIMSLVIVKASAIAIYQNRTPTDAAAGNNSFIYQRPNSLSHFQATTSEFISTGTQTPQPVLDAIQPQTDVNTTVTNHIIRTNIIVGGGGSRDLDLEPKDNMRAKLQQLLQREKEDDEETRQLQQDQQLHLIVSEQEQQQQQQSLHQQQQQQHNYQQHQSQHAILAGENAYLLERIDGGVHEQPIYGTWSTKARRPQAPQMANSIATTTTAGVGGSSAPSSSMQTLIGEVNENVYDHQQQQQHHYERLPRRSSTMTPVRREFHDQIPRPPRLTSRQPSFALRRQFNDTPMPRDEYRPKPFHFPFDGPLPEEFKKHPHQHQQQQSERGSIVGMDDVSNIQDILQKLQLGGLASTKTPSLIMMPTGLHISGTYKNLKSSGIANFFRGKRHKKQMQLQFPMPLQMLNAYPAPVMNIMPQAYQQRIALDQIYPFKPRSPNDINLLAMQQQQQHQQHLKSQQTKPKKQKKKQKDKKNPLASSNLMMHQYPFATAGAEMIYPSIYPPFMAVNITQAPPLSKRMPFKLNLDIFPVLPPSKNVKPLSAYAMEEARIVSSMRPPTALRNPFLEYFSTPAPPSAGSAMAFYNPYSQKQPIYNHIRFPGALQTPHIPMAQTNNLQLAYPDQMQKYLQQQQQQHLYANLVNSQGGHQTPFLPIDCDQPLPSGSAASSSNPKNSPIMVHLNVFPKQKSTTVSSISTNPFYSNQHNNNNNNMNNIQRTTILEENQGQIGPIEPRHQPRALNDTSLTKIARSDTSTDPQRDLVDFEHPIVAANDISEMPTPAALVGNKSADLSDSSLSFYDSRPNLTAAMNAANNNYNINANPNLEQMVSEARTASLFRYPVEDLIQFQVHDAM